MYRAPPFQDYFFQAERGTFLYKDTAPVFYFTEWQLLLYHWQRSLSQFVPKLVALLKLGDRAEEPAQLAGPQPAGRLPNAIQDIRACSYFSVHFPGEISLREDRHCCSAVGTCLQDTLTKLMLILIVTLPFFSEALRVTLTCSACSVSHLF